MHILITGGEGYIGSYLTKYFLETGQYVTVLDSGFNSKRLFQFSGYSRQLRRFRANISNIDAVSRAIDGIDVIYHLASRMDLNNSFRHPVRLVDVNVRGTVNLLSAAHKVGIDRIIYTSSANVYGNVVGANESDTPNPIDMYGASVAAAESILRAYYHKGMDVVILRLYNVWGGRGSESVVNKFVNGCNTVYGDGSQTRDFVHISDVIKSLVKSIKWDSSIYNIGSGEEITISGIWSKLNGENQPSYVETRMLGHPEIIRSCADISYTSALWQAEILISELDGNQIRGLCK